MLVFAALLAGCAGSTEHLTAREALKAFDDDAAQRFHGRMPSTLDADGPSHYCTEGPPHHFTCETMVSANNESLPLIVDGTVVEHGDDFTVTTRAH